MSSASSNTPAERPADTVRTGQRWPHPAMAVFVMAALFIVSQLVAVLLVGILQSISGRGPAGQNSLFGSTTTYQLVFGGIAYGLMIWAMRQYLAGRGLSFASIGLRRAVWRDALIALAALLTYLAAYVTLASILAMVIPGLDINQKQDIGFNGAHGVLNLLPIFVLLVVVAPLVEETIMRGFLFASLRQRLSFPLATIITSLCFGALHLAGSEAGAGPLWIAAIDTFILSVVLCYVREKTGRIWAGVGVHALKNAIAFAYLFIVSASVLR